MNHSSILVTFPCEEKTKESLERIARAHGAPLRFIRMSDLVPEDVKNTEVILGSVPADLLVHADSLKWYQLSSAGADSALSNPYLKEETVLTCASGAYGPSVAEHMLASLLALMKNLLQYNQQQQREEWKPIPSRRTLAGASVLIIGYGDLGATFGRMVRPLGADIRGVRRRPTVDGTASSEGIPLIGFDQLDVHLPQADVVVLCLPSTGQTRHLFSKERLLAMKKDAYLVNGGRGDAVNMTDLAEVLEAGHLAGVALDVTDPEPLPKGHPLWKAPRFLLTPHVAGSFNLPMTRAAIGDIMVENLRRYFADEVLISRVDRNTGYKESQ